MRLHENAIRSINVPTNILYNEEFSIPKPWVLSDETRRIQEEVENLQKQYYQWVLWRSGLVEEYFSTEEIIDPLAEVMHDMTKRIADQSRGKYEL
jgi:hypothetical protein